MPFCPACRFEYVPEVTHCPECGAALVAELPPLNARARSEEDFTPELLCVVQGGIHARLLQDELAGQGIPSRTQPGWSYDPLLWAVPAPPPPIGSTEGGYVAVFVNRGDLARAKTVCRDFESPEFAIPEQPEE